MVKTITLKEIEKHNSSDDCWLAIDGSVYDITAFLDQHPGGEEVVLETAGTDASGAFDDVGHSSDARDMLKKYKIGELPEEEKEKLKEAQAAAATSNSSGGGSSMMGLVVLVAAVVAGYFYYESQKEGSA
mmetsp:Transcript_115298/g.162105  ORF Transcript_115298/g.162105 Transcript_115298/m.162105 type:complete len:130 (+) Transcript_115298:55-444(+)